MTEAITSAIVGHLVGDYLLQNDWMANNKKHLGGHGNTACVVHCCLWTFAVIVFSGWYRAEHMHFIATLLFITHYLQDRYNIISWWMRLRWKDQSRFMRCDEFDLTDMRVVPGLGPWSIIVVDNVWHIVTIWVIWRFIA